MADHGDEAGVFRVSTPDNRATTALVLAEIKGLRDFADARFADVQRQLDVTARIPAEVHSMKERIILIESRVHSIEESDTMQQDRAEKKRDYRAGTLPLILVGVLGTIANVVVFLASH